MELQIAPEPTDVERAALEAALDRLDTPELHAEPAAYRSGWRQAGFDEVLDESTSKP